MVIFHPVAVKKNSFAKHQAASTLPLTSPMELEPRWMGNFCRRPRPPADLRSAAAACTRTSPNPIPFCSPRTFIAAATASFTNAGRRRNSSSSVILPSIHRGPRLHLHFSLLGLFEPSPARFLRRTALPATTSARRRHPPRISLASAPTAGQRRWAERSNTPTGGPFPMSGFFFKASPQEPQTLTSPHRVPLGSSFVFSASRPPQLAGARSGSGRTSTSSWPHAA